MITGTENEVGIDISKLRDTTGCITLDNGYGNTGSCQSAITYIDGDKGILRYRGYPVEVLGEYGVFSEVSYLLIFGELPTREQAQRWSELLTEHELLHESLQHHFEGFPPNAHPMAILAAMINASSCFYPEIMNLEEKRDFRRAAARLLSQVRTIAAFSYKKSIGQPIVYPHPENKYVENFLHMMFSLPYREYVAIPEVVNALRLIFILHADHEQNCGTSTVRMVGSSGANLYASAAAGVCALWGPRHGGANQAVLEMLDSIQNQGMTAKQVIEKVKAREFKLMGFGHRVYKNYDPRAKILKSAATNSSTRWASTTNNSTSPSNSKKRRSRIPSSSNENSTPTWTSTAASCSKPSVFPSTCSRSFSPSDACPAGSHTGTKSTTTPRRASIARVRSIRDRPCGTMCPGTNAADSPNHYLLELRTLKAHPLGWAFRLSGFNLCSGAIENRRREYPRIPRPSVPPAPRPGG
jgi:citrate synthase